MLDEAAELERLGYLLANPQNAGIADSIEEWAGLSSAPFFFQHREQRFVSFNRTAWREEGRPKDIAPFLSTTKLEHKLLPQLSTLDKKELRRKIRRLIKQQVKQVPIEDTKVDRDLSLSIRRQLLARTVIPTERPESSMKDARKYSSQQPLCHTTKPSLREIYKEWDAEFRVAYVECSKQYRRGNTKVEFPPGSFAPSKYPKARYASDPDAIAKLHPTRKNIELAAALL